MRSGSRGLRLPGLTAAVIITFGWWLITASGLVRSVFLPPLNEVVAAAGEDWRNILEATSASLWAALVGYIGGFVAAVVVGMMVGRYARVEIWSSGAIDFFRAIPAVAIVPLALLVFADTFRVEVFAVAWAVFFLSIINVIGGVRHVPETLEMAARSFGGTETIVLRKVAVPWLLPFFLSSLRQNVSVALIVIVVSDMVIGLSGLGFYILRNQGKALFDRMYAAIVIISIIGYASYKLLEVLQYRLFPWWSDAGTSS